MNLHGVDIPEDHIADFCLRHGVRMQSLFGSILQDDFVQESDVDVLVEFEPSVTYSLTDLGGMWIELRDLVGRDVDLKTAAELPVLFREDVLREARPIHGA